ncbi:MAG: DinB family protein [Dehalococcoidales bacterium]|nr:MAG: DinB family protein [Dehalococcoidales bacterium]
MEWKDLIIQIFDISLDLLESYLDGLRQEDLNWQPKPDCNSIGWKTWHLSRVIDRGISLSTDEEQLWITDGWCNKFDRPADPDDRDHRQTPEQIAAFKSPDKGTLIGYYRAVIDKLRNWLNMLDNSDLDREFDDSVSHILPTARSRVNAIVRETQQHLGQIAYDRGLLQGHGWQ